MEHGKPHGGFTLGRDFCTLSHVTSLTVGPLFSNRLVWAAIVTWGGLTRDQAASARELVLESRIWTVFSSFISRSNI